MNTKTFTITTKSAEETQKLAEKLCPHLSIGDILSLTGDLGAGKTCFVKGLARGLGIGRIVTSPTFNLIREYLGQLPLYHFDVYRIENPSELFNLGYEEYFYGDGVTVIEWGDKISKLIPPNHLAIDFRYFGDTNQRRLEIIPGNIEWETKARKWVKDADFSV